MSPYNVLQSLNHSLHRLFECDERVHLIGEDLLDPYGGAFKVSAGLSTRYPDRVWTTPISEGAIVGIGVGMALRGLRPIAEIMFGDFVMLAGDQIVNHAAKFRWMFNDGVRVPLVIRTPMGGGRGYGPTHSQSLEKHFLGVPGLWVVAPSVFGDPGALLEQATLECDDPVLFVESKTCYARALAPAPASMVAERISTPDSPFPTLHFKWSCGASHGLMCCYGAMAPIVSEAVAALAASEGLYLDIALFSQLSPTPFPHLDRLIAAGVDVCVVTEEASVMGGWSADLVASFEERRSALDAGPVKYVRVGSRHEPVASSRWLERQTLPSVTGLVSAVLDQF